MAGRVGCRCQSDVDMVIRMVEPITRDEFLAHIEPIRQDIQELVQLQRQQNGRVARAEIDIAILKERTPHRTAAALGATAGTAAGALLHYLQVFFKF